MSKKEKLKKDRVNGVKGKKEVKDKLENEIYDEISSLIDDLSSGTVNGGDAERAPHGDAGTEAGEIERKVVDFSEMFPEDPEFKEKKAEAVRAPEEKTAKDGVEEIETAEIGRSPAGKFEIHPDTPRSNEKSQGVAEIPARDDVQIEGKAEPAAGERRAVEHGVADVFDKHIDTPQSDEKNQKISEIPMEIEIETEGEIETPQSAGEGIAPGAAEVLGEDVDSPRSDEKSKGVAEIPADTDIQTEGKGEAGRRAESEIENGVAEVFDTFLDSPSLDEKAQKIAEIPVEIEIEIEEAVEAPESKAMEIENGVAEVFDKFIDSAGLDEKSRKGAEIPADIFIEMEEDEPAENEEGKIAHAVSAVFGKYEAVPEIRRKKQEIVGIPVKIEMEDAVKGDTKRDRPGSSRVIYAAVGILIILIALTVAELLKPTEEPDKTVSPVTTDVYRIEQPSKRVSPPKVMPLKTESNKKPETDASESAVPPGEASESPERISQISEAKDMRDEIPAFLMKWKTAWENTAGNRGDIDAYMTFYSDGFETKGFDKSGWIREKAQTNKRKEWIRITLTDIQIAEPLPDGRVEVSFIQDYGSSNFSEKSEKKLILRKEKTGWMIIGSEDPIGEGGSMSPERTEQPAPVSSGYRSYPYTIHVASYREKDVANRAVEALRKDGFAAFTSYAEIPGKGAWYRIFVDYFETADEARKAALKLKHQEIVSANAVEKPYAIQVGIFDSESELRKIESDLGEKGYNPYRVPEGRQKGGTKICIGAYDSIKDASAEKQNLQNDHFTAAVIKR